jgi:hypothetical protein
VEGRFAFVLKRTVGNRGLGVVALSGLVSLAACTDSRVLPASPDIHPDPFIEDVWAFDWRADVDAERLAAVQAERAPAAEWDKACVSWSDRGGLASDGHLEAFKRQRAAVDALDPDAIACDLASLGELLRSGDRRSDARVLYEGEYATTVYAGVLAGLDLEDELAFICDQQTRPDTLRVSISLARRRIVEAVAVGAAPPELIDAAKTRDRAHLPVCEFAT